MVDASGRAGLRVAAAPARKPADLRARMQGWLPKLVLAPSAGLVFFFVYGFILYTIYLSFTGSRMLPSYDWVGWRTTASSSAFRTGGSPSPTSASSPRSTSASRP